MKGIKKTRSFALFGTILLLQCALIPAWIGRVQAESPNPNKATSVRRSRVTFKPRRGKAQPKEGTVISGGRRNNGMCEQFSETRSKDIKGDTIEKTLVPLLPSSKLGLTASSHPSFMVYVPPTSAKALEFTLENSEGEGIYQKEVNLGKTPGVISFSLPKTEAPLEIDSDYRFVVSIICEQTGPKNPYVEGLVRRISPDSKLINQQDKPNSLEQVILYSESGYWFEAIENLAALKVAKPNDSEVAEAWETLLESVGLDTVAKAPLQN